MSVPPSESPAPSGAAGLVLDHHFKKLRLGAFVAVLYAYCAAGPFGFEDMISISGPGMALLFLVVVPWLYSLPMSLAAAEMATALPVEGGFYRWTRTAFGDFWGFLCGFWNWCGTFLMNAAYAVLLADYAGQVFPSLAAGWPHWLTALFFLLLVAGVNILGIQAVGKLSVVFLVLALLPVALFTVLGFMKTGTNPFAPLTPPGKPWDEVYGAGLAIGLWFYSGYEQLSTNIEEVENPARNFPRGLAIMVPLAMITFVLPTMAGLGACQNWAEWKSGYMVTAARMIGGTALEWSMFGAATLSVLLGLQSTLLSSTRLPFALAEDGYFHPSFARLNRTFRTPVQAIILTTALCAVLSVFSVAQLVATYIWLRVATSTLTLLSLWRLRMKRPDLPRRFLVPGGRIGLAAVVVAPLLLFVWGLIHSDPASRLWGPAGLAAGLVAYPFLYKRK